MRDRILVLLGPIVGVTLRVAGPVAAALLLVVCLAPAADQPKSETKPSAPADVQDLVFLGEARPLLIRLHVQVDGKPVQAAWDDFMKDLFGYLDVNGDGVLSKEEAERAPALEQILGRGQGGFGGLGGPRATAGPTMAALDADGDGQVTRAELAAYYRNNGFAPLQFQFNSGEANPLGAAAALLGGGGVEPSVAAVREAVFDLLDTNKDGKLTKDELAAAPATLLQMDEDEDEIVTARELVPNARPSTDLFAARGMMGRQAGQGAASGNKTLVLVTAPGEAPADLVPFLQERYGPAADRPEAKKLSRKDLGLDEATFKQLDSNGDGVLDGRELAGFVKRAPDVEVVVRLGRKKAEEARLAVTPAGKVTAKDGQALLDLGVTRLDLRSGEEARANPFGIGAPADRLRQQYLDQFKTADADGNGYLDANEASNSRLFRTLFKAIDRDGDGKVTRKELLAYLDRVRDLRERGQGSCAALVLSDESRGLFELLDANGDGRLSVREMRGAVKLLQQLDRDGKGYLARSDVPRRYGLTLRRGAAGGGVDGAAVFAALYGGSGRSEAEQPQAGPLWFRKMDRNRDGDVSRKEFLFGEDLFRRIDTDGDGLISLEEAQKAGAVLGPELEK